MKKTCYACSQRATSREHFPPKCFFPNKGKSLQLKTVPSCPKHNGGKSGDDLYVLTHICLNASRNGINLPAKRFIESVVPQLESSPKFKTMLMKGSVDLEAGARAYVVDSERFDSFFDHLVCAVFFHRYGKRLDENQHRVRHVYLNFESGQDRAKSFAASTIQLFKEDYKAFVETVEADKYDEIVYRYDVIDPGKEFGSITIGHSFYGIFDVISFLTLNAEFFIQDGK